MSAFSTTRSSTRRISLAFNENSALEKKSQILKASMFPLLRTPPSGAACGVHQNLSVYSENRRVFRNFDAENGGVSGPNNEKLGPINVQNGVIFEKEFKDVSIFYQNDSDTAQLKIYSNFDLSKRITRLSLYKNQTHLQMAVVNEFESIIFDFGYQFWKVNIGTIHDFDTTTMSQVDERWMMDEGHLYTYEIELDADASYELEEKSPSPSFENRVMNYTCGICLENNITNVIVECGHGLCGPCAMKINNMTPGRKKCFMCRGTFFNFVPIFN